jgi:S-methyl-5-thioribose-1-phosphate isomerase
MPVRNSEDAWTVIRNMNVRGAPLIAIVACLGLAVEVHQRGDTLQSLEAAAEFLVERMHYLRTSRPTAVNLFTATDQLIAFVQRSRDERALTAQQLIDEFVSRCEAMLDADIAANKAIGAFGADAIQARAVERNQAPDKIRVLTICNTGSLATAGYGTALGVVRALHERKALEHIFACETRPYNQGARLTAFEIVEEGMPGTLICDSMASALMRKTPVNAVVVGADRVAANGSTARRKPLPQSHAFARAGDTANKIGTYQLAIIAKYYGADFYVAAPSTSCDVTIPSGEHIPIEERPAQELRVVAGVQVRHRTHSLAIFCFNHHCSRYSAERSHRSA